MNQGTGRFEDGFKKKGKRKENEHASDGNAQARRRQPAEIQGLTPGRSFAPALLPAVNLKHRAEQRSQHPVRDQQGHGVRLAEGQAALSGVFLHALCHLLCSFGSPAVHGRIWLA